MYDFVSVLHYYILYNVYFELLLFFFFFFSSRRRHTRLQGDWSSDVCSSDLKKISLVYDVGGVDCLTVSVQGRFKHLAFVFLEVVLSLSYGLHDSFVVVS